MGMVVSSTDQPGTSAADQPGTSAVDQQGASSVNQSNTVSSGPSSKLSIIVDKIKRLSTRDDDTPSTTFVDSITRTNQKITEELKKKYAHSMVVKEEINLVEDMSDARLRKTTKKKIAKNNKRRVIRIFTADGSSYLLPKDDRYPAQPNGVYRSFLSANKLSPGRGAPIWRNMAPDQREQYADMAMQASEEWVPLVFEKSTIVGITPLSSCGAKENCPIVLC